MDIEQVLKAQGLKVTPQRRAILTAMNNTEAFLSAQDLFIEVTKLLPGTNFSTIYRNLEVLLARKILCSVTPEGNGTLYKLRHDEGHHHHALCKSCGASIPMDFCPLEAMYEELESHGFTPTTHTFEIYGYCKECKPKK
jgi:Fe2+ or Zn2+ uptake regulation protein